MENQFEIYITDLIENNSTQIWMCMNDHDGRYNLNMEGISIKLTKLNPGSISSVPLKPLIELPRIYAKALFREIQEYLRKGIKTKDESKLEGTLAATEKHLSDMQTIAFKLLDSKLGITIDAS